MADFKNGILEILTYLKRERNFDFNAYNPGMLERRIQNRIIRVGATSNTAYLELLSSSPGESQHLIENFMINVSRFFRDPLCFELLGKWMNQICIEIAQKRDRNSIRIWSVGCAHGEEPYSIAIMLNEFIKHENLGLRIDLFATDYDSQALKKAKQGIYSVDSIAEVKHSLVEKYFVKTTAGFEVIPEIKSLVQFSEYDLLDRTSYAPTDSIFGEFDIILCRNVLIYFNQEFQEFILSKLTKALAPHGLLILGEAEIPVSSFRTKFKRLSDQVKIYEKL